MREDIPECHDGSITDADIADIIDASDAQDSITEWEESDIPYGETGHC